MGETPNAATADLHLGWGVLVIASNSTSAQACYSEIQLLNHQRSRLLPIRPPMTCSEQPLSLFLSPFPAQMNRSEVRRKKSGFMHGNAPSSRHAHFRSNIALALVLASGFPSAEMYPTIRQIYDSDSNQKSRRYDI